MNDFRFYLRKKRTGENIETMLKKEIFYLNCLTPSEQFHWLFIPYLEDWLKGVVSGTLQDF